MGAVSRGIIGRFAAGLILLGVAVAGCAEQVQQASDLPGGAARTTPPATAAPGLPSVPAPGQPLPPLQAGKVATPSQASAKIAEYYPAPAPGLPSIRQTVAPRGTGDIQFNFDDADLREVVQVVLRDALGETVVIDPDVRGRVSLRSGRGLTREQALQALETALQANGAVLLRTAGGFRVASSANAPTAAGGPRLRLPGFAEAGYGLQVHPLRYIGAEEMAKILKPLLPEGRVVTADAGRNLIVVAGTGPEQRLASETIQVFDIDVMAGQSVLLESLQNADVGTLVFELENIFGSKNGPLAGAVRFIPIERMNAVLVLAQQPRYLDEARNWIARLDRTRNATSRRLYVYYAQNGKAANIAKTLRGIFGGGPLAPEPSVLPRTPVAGNTPVPSPTQAVGGPQPGVSGGGVPSAIAALAEQPAGSDNGPRIIADEATNSIIVLATPKDYEGIEEVLAKLDIMPLQVQLETSILEVTLNDQLRYGVQYFIGNSRNVPAELALSIVPGAGFSYLFGATVDPRVLISLLSTITEVNVVSSPQVMVLDNQSARLQVGDEVPILTRFVDITGSAADPRTVNSVEYRQTGVTLEVVPRINVSGLVTLDIGQEVSDVSPPDSGAAIQSPTIRQRRILSSVAVASGQTVALGGLIRESNNVSNSGVPILHTLPLIGNLFGYRSGNVQRTELLVFITPRVIRNQREARDATQEMRQKFQSILAMQDKGPPLLRTPTQP